MAKSTGAGARRSRYRKRRAWRKMVEALPPEKRRTFHESNPTSLDIRCGRCGVAARMKGGVWLCPKCGATLGGSAT